MCIPLGKDSEDSRAVALVQQLGYCQFLLSSPFNYTQTYFADHVAGLSHDKINRLMQRVTVTSQDLWQGIQETLILDPAGYLLFDDTVLDKNHSFKGLLRVAEVSLLASGLSKGVAA